MLIIGGLSSESKVCCYWFRFVGSSSTVTTVQRRKLSVRCVYDIDLTYALRIENTSESDPSTYEATKAVAKKSPQKSTTTCKQQQYIDMQLKCDMLISAVNLSYQRNRGKGVLHDDFPLSN